MKEARVLSRILSRVSNRFCLVTATTGAGKTRIVKWLAQHLPSPIFVDSDPYGDFEDLPRTGDLQAARTRIIEELGLVIDLSARSGEGQKQKYSLHQAKTQERHNKQTVLAISQDSDIYERLNKLPKVELRLLRDPADPDRPLRRVEVTLITLSGTIEVYRVKAEWLPGSNL